MSNPIKTLTLEENQEAQTPVDPAAEKAARLKRLGLVNAAGAVHKEIERKNRKTELKHKLTIAYEHYRVVTQAKVDEFNIELRKKTEKAAEDSSAFSSIFTARPVVTYDQLVFVELGKYSQVPPDHVLDALEVARERGCFDSFEVGVLETVEVRPDPILFGRISGSPDRFFIDQWDDDVKIQDILKDNEG